MVKLKLMVLKQRTVSGVTSEKTSASKSENYIGGSIFAETEYAGLTLGLIMFQLQN